MHSLFDAARVHGTKEKGTNKTSQPMTDTQNGYNKSNRSDINAMYCVFGALYAYVQHCTT